MFDKLFCVIIIIIIGKDVIGLAETGSGKTGAFALPILQALLDSPGKLYALVLTPTRFVNSLWIYIVGWGLKEMGGVCSKETKVAALSVTVCHIITYLLLLLLLLLFTCYIIIIINCCSLPL